jgi:hypothetical protein
MQVNDLNPHFTVVYLLRKEKCLINAVYELTCEGFICANYTKKLDKKQNDFVLLQQHWYQFTRNSYYDTAIRNWCMLFGSRNEPTHYSKLLILLKLRLSQFGIGSTIGSLRENLLNYAGLSKKYMKHIIRLPKNTVICILCIANTLLIS